MIEVCQKTIDRWDELIRLGKGELVRRDLNKVKPSQVQRSFLVHLAGLARRIGMSNFGAKLLFPYVGLKSDSLVAGSDAEKIEYAACLIELGVLRDAELILGQVDLKSHPEANFSIAQLGFHRWDYDFSIPFLQDYIASSNEDYRRSIGEVNLVAALIMRDRFQEAKRLLNHLKEYLNSKGYDLLLGSCFELEAQVAIGQNDLAMADQAISRSLELLGESKNVAYLFALKWKAILDLIQDPNHLKPILSVQKRARLQNVWETVRDCEFQMAKLQKDQDRLERVFYGTPFKEYKNRVLGQCDFELSRQYLFSKPGSRPDRVLSLKKACLVGSPEITLKAGQVPHRILRTLSSDFYAPFSLGRIYSEVFPEEYYDPFSSPERVFKGIQRLRAWFKKYKLPVKVEHQNGGYRLVFGVRAGILIERSSDKPMSKPEIEIDRIADRLSKFPAFSARQLSEALGVSLRSANRILKEAKAKGRVEQVGSGPKTSYKLVS